jgi:carboxyl-terminal processing protease
MENFEPAKKQTSTTKIYLSIVSVAVFFGIGFFVGQTWHIKKQETQAQELTIDRSISHTADAEFNQFWKVWDRIKQKYVKQPISDTDMLYGAIQGLVMSLDDPHSIYFPPKAAEEFSKDLSGELEGIGAEIGVKNNQLLVISPLPGSPAEKAGLLPGDKIIAIDKLSTVGLDASDAVTKIRGKADTKVTLTIGRDKVAKTQDIVITRAKINVPSVVYSLKKTLKGQKVGYFKVMSFNQDTTSGFEHYVSQLPKDVKGVILDLRNNPGGYLDTAVDLASKWVTGDGVIVSEKGLNGLHDEFKTKGDHPLAGIKTVVLVNKGSASASEILAGALQDYKLATIVGEKTFGKGSVQDLENFPDGSALKLTIAEWFTPLGRNINKEGIAPDIEVKQDWSKEKIGEDKMLSKGLELISK